MTMFENPAPLVSIITVCYNEIERIKLTCDSVVNQTMQNFEWIVLDGGSTDGTLDVLSKYCHRMTYFKTGPDDGIYAAMNQGIDEAKGMYCIFLNGGDCFHADNTLTLVKPYLDGKEQVLIGGCIIVEKSVRTTYIRNSWTKRDFLYYSPPHQSTFFKTSVFENLDKLDETYKVYADQEFYLRCIKHNIRLMSIPLIISDFYNDGLSSFTTLHSKGEERRLRRQYYHLYLVWYIEMIRNPIIAVRKLLGRWKRQFITQHS